MGQIIKKRKNWNGSFIEKFWIVGRDGEVREWTVEIETKNWMVERWLFKSGDDEVRFESENWGYMEAVEELERRV